MNDINVRKLELLMGEFSKTLTVPRKKAEKLIILAPHGPSCVGKTKVMKYIADRLPFVHIQHDAIRFFLRGKGLDENKYLYKHELLPRVAERFLRKGYSVIADANFATNHKHVEVAEEMARKHRASFVLIRVVAPKSFIVKKLGRKKFLPMDRGGLLPDRETALEHLTKSSKQFDYDRLMPHTLKVINSSRPLGLQLRTPLRVLRGMMGLKK